MFPRNQSAQKFKQKVKKKKEKAKAKSKQNAVSVEIKNRRQLFGLNQQLNQKDRWRHLRKPEMKHTFLEIMYIIDQIKSRKVKS